MLVKAEYKQYIVCGHNRYRFDSIYANDNLACHGSGE